MRNDMKRRKSLEYKIKFWFYRLTFGDVTHIVGRVFGFGIEFVMCAIALGLIFLIPALLR